MSKPGAGFAHGLSRYARRRAEAVEETGLPLQKLPAGICKIITSVILQEGISHKSVLAKESAVAMVTQQTGRGGKAEPLLWALYTIFNIKSLVLAFQIEL